MQVAQEVPYDRFNPYPWYSYMRKHQPVYYNEQAKMWYVFRYADIQNVLADTKTFSSEGIQGKTYLESSFLRMDPPRHRRYRSLVSQAFTPRSVAELTPRITAIIQQSFDAVANNGRMDVIADLAHPLPATVIAELFGVPVADREYFKQLSDLFIEETENTTTTHFVSQEKLAELLLPLIEERRSAPTNDLTSALLAAEIDGEKLSTFDIQASSILMLVAGHETTTDLIGNTLFCLTEFPETMEELRTHPELIPDAIEEVLRFRSPVSGGFRITTADTQIGEIAIQAGQPLITQFSSGNRDETIFEDADRFDMRRSPNRHLGFGHGIHYCLGAPLARLETTIAIQTMLERFTDIQRDPAHPVQLSMGPGGLFQGTKTFPLTFTARA